MSDLFAQIEYRADVTPRMTAVRLAGEAVSYGELHESVSAYWAVVESQELSPESALSAALMSKLPAQLRALQPVAQAEWVGAATRWLEEHAMLTGGTSLNEAV